MTVVVSDESDFTPDIHQVILLEPCYGLLLIAKDGGGSELNDREAIEVRDFQGIYYFESGCLWLGYTNSMPYDHPLDRQGHIASVLHSDTAAYSSYIGLIAGTLIANILTSLEPFLDKIIKTSGAAFISCH